MTENNDDGPDPIETLDDGEDRELTMAQLKSRLDIARQKAAEGRGPDPLRAQNQPRPRSRDDELLADPPMSERHSAFSGWRAGSRARPTS